MAASPYPTSDSHRADVSASRLSLSPPTSCPATTARDAAVMRVCDAVQAAAQSGTPLRIVGSGTRSFLGDPVDAAALPVSDVRGIVDYQPSELVITARAGTPLAEIEAALDERRQCLAFEPPRFGVVGAAAGAASGSTDKLLGGLNGTPGGITGGTMEDMTGGTVGGMVAAGLSGPGRMAGGSLRDAVLGAVLLNGRGEILRFGGQVIKNVAGYDVSRLLAGSLGTLGVILEVSLRVAPQAAASLTLTYEMPQAQAIDQVNRWLAQAMPIQASAWYQGRLWLRLQGARGALTASRPHLGGEALPVDDAVAFWNALRDHSHPQLAEPAELPLWRLALPPTHPPLALDGQPLVEWHGGQRWWRSALPAATVRAAAREAGGHATRFRTGTSMPPVDDAPTLTPLEGPMAQIESAVKQAFDPRGIFNPGRRPYAPTSA